MRSNWPTEEAINRRIQLSEDVNQRYSRLHATGFYFLKFGRKYRINPAVVVAISQRECQLGADGSTLPKMNNFGGITDPNEVRGNCGHFWHIDRYWANYCTPVDGIKGIFEVLNEPGYRKGTDGTIRGVINRYSPAFENDLDDLYRIFAIVGNQLGVILDPDTPVYVPRWPRWRFSRRS